MLNIIKVFFVADSKVGPLAVFAVDIALHFFAISGTYASIIQ
jgi:hypothetical protein